MPDLHLSLLGLEIPNLLPESIFGYGVTWTRPAGRLIWATLVFAIGTGFAFWLTTKPKKAEPSTWAMTILGAMFVWAMMALGYGTIPHEWLTFGTSYLNFSTATFVMRRNSIIHFDIDRAAVIDIGGTIIYGIVLTLQVWLFVRWQKRPTIEQAAAKAAESDGGEEPGGGPLARLRRRREKRVSAYGRPVTTEAT